MTTGILIVTGMIVSSMFMYLMSKCARCLAMTGVAILLLSFFGGGGACFYFAISGASENDAKTALLITGGVLVFFGLCTMCMIWCNRNSLETAIAIIDASADFMFDTKRLVIVSIMYFIVAMIFIFTWLFACLCLFANVPFEEPSPLGSQVKIPIVGGKEYAMFAFMFFGLLWVL